jgi:hypothetical protein
MAGIVPFQSYIVNRNYREKVWNKNNYTKIIWRFIKTNSPNMKFMPGFHRYIHPIGLDVAVFA